jgi:hypothetical protein
MINEVIFEVLDIYPKTFRLLYADDTVLISENVDGMQTMLNVFSEYYNTWKLRSRYGKYQFNIVRSRVRI